MDKKLILYTRNFCYFCQKVEFFMVNEKIDLEVRNISESDVFRKELMTGGGKTQTPCLFIDGVAMYESDDIIEWLGENYHARTN
tara:strand:- start:898 stop:1149 length:252 start_codon:yes stop_codon:yes gene_type:complete